MEREDGKCSVVTTAGTVSGRVPPVSHQQSGGWRVMPACQPHGAMRLGAPSDPSGSGKRKLDPSPGSEFTGPRFQQPDMHCLPLLIVAIAVATVGGSWRHCWLVMCILQQDPWAQCLLVAAELRCLISGLLEQQRGSGRSTIFRVSPSIFGVTLL